MALIEIDNVSFSYDGENQALCGVSLSIEGGEFVCILGSNGSGKSTLAKHMNGLIVPQSGEVRVQGAPTSDARSLAETRRLVGMVFQNPDDQIVASTVEDDVAFGPENLGVEPAEIRERVTDALARVGLDGFEGSSTYALSGGQKQRVALAGALAMKPRALVLDEAESMLDPRGRRTLLGICRELQRDGIAIVLITHSTDMAALADRVVVLNKGSVVFDGTPLRAFADIEDLAEIGLDAPFAVRLSRALREKGLPMELQIDADALADEIMRYSKS